MIRHFKIWCAYIILILTSTGCPLPDKQPVDQKNFDGPDQEGWQGKIIVTSKGHTSAIVQYGHMEKYSKKGEVQFNDGVVVDFYNDSGDHSSQLTAEQGILLEENSNVEASKNVVVVSDSGITLLTERLQWDKKDEKIFTEEFVTIVTNKKDTLNGTGFYSAPNLNNWTIKKPVGVMNKKFDMSGSEFEKREQNSDTTF